MAESATTRRNLDFFLEEPRFSTEAAPARDARRNSTSTVGSSRRQSAYDSQRISRRSRPPSGASQATLKSLGKRASYKEPADYENVDESTMPPPVPADADSRPHLEDERSKGQRGAQGQGVSNFSRPQTQQARRRPSGASNKDQELSELSALPPVPSSAAGRRQSRRRTQDAERGGDSESSNEPPAFSRKHPHDLLPVMEPVPKWLTQIYTVSYLIFFSLLGTLARLGVQWLTFYSGAPITTPVVWANMGGSILMGFLSEDQALFRAGAQAVAAMQANEKVDPATLDKATLTKHKKVIPLYIGLATGFCGCFTSFSSFARDFFLAMSNGLPAPIYHTFASPSGAVLPTSTVGRNGGYSFEALLAVWIYTLALSLGGLIVGAQMAIFLDGFTAPIPVHFTRKFLDPLVVFLSWGCWLGAIFLSIWPPDRTGGPAAHRPPETWRGEVLFALVFAPLGCLLRFYASLKLNGLVAAFPLGTFAVNMFGTAVEGMCYDIQHVGVGNNGIAGGGVVGCQVLQGIMDGFCGCLTTVSTWVSEINGLKRKHGYLYALASIIGALCLMVIIMGSVQWSVGFTATACNTGYPSKVHG